MPYRIRYTVNIDWVGPGSGPMQALNPTGGNLPGGGSTGQTRAIVTNAQAASLIVQGAGAGGTINATDITNLTNAMAADAVAQFNAASNLAVMQGWATGQP